MTDADLKELYDRKIAAMRRRPSFGRGAGRARVRMGAGFACHVDHGDRADTVDLAVAEGGDGSGGSPAQLLRAGIGACLAMGYRLWGAMFGVPIDAVEVEMVCEFDCRGQLDAHPEAPLGWTRVTIEVTVVSDAPADDIGRVAAQANRLSPMLATLSPAIERSIALRIRPATATAVSTLARG